MALWVRVECDGREQLGQLEHNEVPVYEGVLFPIPSQRVKHPA